MIKKIILIFLLVSSIVFAKTQLVDQNNSEIDLVKIGNFTSSIKVIDNNLKNMNSSK